MPDSPHKSFVMTETASSSRFKDSLQRLPGILPLNGTRPLTADEYEAIYKEPPAFTQFLPFKDYDKEQQVFLLDDGLSVGAVFELTPIDVEGQSQKVMEIIESGIQQALQRLPGDRDYPIIVQTYLNDEPITDLVDQLRAYATDEARDTRHHEIWMNEMEEHLRHLAKEEGLFRDDVAQFNWNGQYRRVRCVIYRKSNPSDYLTKAGQAIPGRGTPSMDLNDAVESFISALRQIGIESRRYAAADLYNWLLPWFSPRPDSFESAQEYLKARPFPDDDSCIGIGADLSELLFTGYPESDKEDGLWKFHGMPHQLIALQVIDNPPATGILTAEIKTHAGSTASIWDVVTPEQFDSASLNWIQEKGSDERKIVHQVFKQFMSSPQAHLFHTCTGLISFGIVQWKVQFEEWVKQEVQRLPGSEANIRRYTGLLIQLLESSWAIESKLIVSECLYDRERQLMDRENT